MPPCLDEGQLAALQRAAAALAGQDGRGLPRDVLVGLAGRDLAVTMHLASGVLAVVHPSPVPRVRFASLTAREREVAALVAAGKTNVEIAATLVIAHGTVKDHVHSVLAKTGLRSRAAVAGAWHGHALGM